MLGAMVPDDTWQHTRMVGQPAFLPLTMWVAAAGAVALLLPATAGAAAGHQGAAERQAVRGLVPACGGRHRPDGAGRLQPGAGQQAAIHGAGRQAAGAAGLWGRQGGKVGRQRGRQAGRQAGGRRQVGRHAEGCRGSGAVVAVGGHSPGTKIASYRARMWGLASACLVATRTGNPLRHAR